MTTRLPAYAKELAERRRRGLTLAYPLVTVALHWRRRPTIGYGVIIPTDVDPSVLAWTWVRNLEVIVIARGDDPARVHAASAAIARARPKRLVVLNVDELQLTSVVEPAAEERHAA